MIADRFWVACCSLCSGGDIQEDGVVADGEDAFQFVGDNHDGGSEALAEVKDKIIKSLGAQGIKTGGRLIEEENLRIERHGPREARALVHAPLMSEG